MADSTAASQREDFSFVDVCEKAGRKSGLFVSLPRLRHIKIKCPNLTERGSMTRSILPEVDAFDLAASVLLFGHAAAHKAALRIFKLHNPH
jgi:hypothetical protein